MNFQSPCRLLSGAGILLGLFLCAVSQQVVYADMVIEQPASDDNYIHASSLTTVQDVDGSGLTLRTKQAGNATRMSYIKYDLSNFTPRTDLAASLKLTVFDSDGSGTDYYNVEIWALNSGWSAVNDELGTDWTESEIYWNNAPGLGATVGGSSADTPRIADATMVDSYTVLGTASSGTMLPSTIPSLAPYLQSDTSLTFMVFVRDQVAGGSELLDFHSSEAGALGPMLTFEGTVIPEPGSLVLLVMASFAFLLRFRFLRNGRYGPVSCLEKSLN